MGADEWMVGLVLSVQKIGRYVIREVLGKGSMGVVYSAHDPQLDRTVAIKTINIPGTLTPGIRERRTQSLLTEARLSARLNHPGIVRVYDAGEQDGMAYIVLELVEGRTLLDMLEQDGHLHPDAVTAMMAEVLEAMAYAHEHGLVHRDLKPANIMVQPDGHVRIMDFGIAHLVTERQADSGKLSGTPRYMSPEQINGQAVDTRSDVFSLGVIFYELLSGRKPFPQTDLGSLVRAIRETPHPQLQALRPDLPSGLYALINRALAKRPEERFHSARQMLEALAACQEASLHEEPSAEQSRKEIIDFILQKIARRGDFPTTMQYIATITEAARRANASAHTIAEAILKDFALTNRILRMVNSPFYNGARRSITTISRAVVVLGVNAVLDVAAGLSIFEHFHNRCDVPQLKVQTLQALMTAFHAREIANQAGYRNVEEAFICGMMHHLGRLVVAFYFPEEYFAIEQLARQGLCDEATASRRVMRITYGELGEVIGRSWHFPEAVFKCSRGLAAHHRGELRTPEQVLQGIVSMASELSAATMIPEEAKRVATQALVMRQFEGMISLTKAQIQRITEYSIRNAWDISHALRVNLKDLGVADSLLAAVEQSGQGGAAILAETSPCQEISPSQALCDPPDETALPTDGPEAQRHDFLIKTIGEITMALMGSYQLNDVLMMVLEGMYRGVGSQHVLLALVNPQRTQLVYRFGLGPNTEEIRCNFNLPLTRAGGLPAQCIMESREIFIPNIHSESRRDALPGELRDLLQARSLLLLPITIKDLPIGLFLLDRAPGQAPISQRDLLNLRTLANQAVLAIRQCQPRR